jgi:hypothetical protein
MSHKSFVEKIRYFFNFKLIFLNILMGYVKNNFLKNKKYYFNIFLNKKTSKNNYNYTLKYHLNI